MRVSFSVALYSPDQIRKMEQSIQIRGEFKPVELIKWVRTKRREPFVLYLLLLKFNVLKPLLM